MIKSNFTHAHDLTVNKDIAVLLHMWLCINCEEARKPICLFLDITGQ